MNNNHEFKSRIEIRCPFEGCGKTFNKTITVQYVTNQKGDIIEHRII